MHHFYWFHTGWLKFCLKLNYTWNKKMVVPLTLNVVMGAKILFSVLWLAAFFHPLSVCRNWSSCKKVPLFLNSIFTAYQQRPMEINSDRIEPRNDSGDVKNEKDIARKKALRVANRALQKKLATALFYVHNGLHSRRCIGARNCAKNMPKKAS